MSNQKLKIAFFGGEPLGLPALKALVHADLIPTLVVCNPDRQAGRGQKVTPSLIKTWATEQSIEVFQPTTYKERNNLTRLTSEEWDLFVVVAYNFILPEWFLKLPKHGVVNVHPSLLPKLRGASPIRTAILKNLREEIGVSIMLMDKEMDHGPILTQTPLTLNEWPIDGPLLDDMLAQIGGEMLARTIPRFIAGEITPVEQDHLTATYTKKFEKADAELHLDPQNLPTGNLAFEILCKIKALAGMSDCFFFDNGLRIKIKAANLKEDGQLQILRVIPEGKKEVDFETYLRSR
ncbi:MAG: methionyl-tRNA formyltransferase [Candidatus Pacebacteria bacterium]|nr:methionyl-tRNA formyltransferase [Candidatus Paceibacterota bacterium]MBP9842595.1 methionyl-tRNA formyltransferase [Candidatus Paceibacterota bacterium]